MNILIVDDHAYNRDLLRFVLEDEGHDCFDADSGQAAIDFLEDHSDVDMILMDVNMPGIDGMDATRVIRDQYKKERLLPIIFVTALDNPEILIRCLDVGGNDFVPKPVNEDILISKVNAHARIQNVYEELRLANDKLTYHKQLMDREHTIVEHVFSSAVEQSQTICDNIVQRTSPMSMFNGDLVLVAPSPAGGVYLLVGDFTGHGLSAAIGSLPVMEIFNSHAALQGSVGEMASSMNRSLRRILPVGMFFCATILHLDRSGGRISYWSGGMNQALLVSPDTSKIIRLRTDHMPLGITVEEEFDEGIQVHDVDPLTKIYIYTDGVNEAKNAEQEEFGDDRVESLIKSCGQDVISEIVRAVQAFEESVEQTDDLTIIELTCAPVVHRSKQSGIVIDAGADYTAAECFPWNLEMRLNATDLKNTDIVRQVLSFLSAIQGVELHKDKLFTIVSELYSNALEHGVLMLNSDLKADPDGFDEYYRLREERLNNLSDDYIEIALRYIRGDTNRICLEITDSGDGFDFDSKISAFSEGEESHGRGLSLLSSLCSSIQYSNSGRTVTAYYDFSSGLV